MAAISWGNGENAAFLNGIIENLDVDTLRTWLSMRSNLRGTFSVLLGRAVGVEDVIYFGNLVKIYAQGKSKYSTAVPAITTHRTIRLLKNNIRCL